MMIPLHNTEERYGSVAMFFHWVIMLLFLILVVLGLTMTNMEDSAEKWQLYSLHKSFGLTLALLVVLRIFWRFTNPVPLLPETLKAYEKFLAHAVHIGLYGIMLIMPISGVIDSYAGGYKMDFFGLGLLPKAEKRSEWGESVALMVHVYGSYLFYGLFFLHIAGVIKHHFILKDNTLRRMLPVSLKKS
nr:cytochrome b [Beggiatoa alba]